MRQGGVGWIFQLDHKGGREPGEEDHAWQRDQQSNIDFSPQAKRKFWTIGGPKFSKSFSKALSEPFLKRRHYMQIFCCIALIFKDRGGCSMERTWNYPPTHAKMEGAPFNPSAAVDSIRISIGSCGTHHSMSTHASRRGVGCCLPPRTKDSY